MIRRMIDFTNSGKSFQPRRSTLTGWILLFKGTVYLLFIIHALWI